MSDVQELGRKLLDFVKRGFEVSQLATGIIAKRGTLLAAEKLEELARVSKGAAEFPGLLLDC